MEASREALREVLMNDREVLTALLLKQVSPAHPIECLKLYLTRATVSLQATTLNKILGLFSCCLDNQDSHFLYGPTCSIVVSRVIKIQSNSEHAVLMNTLGRLDKFALEWLVTKNQFIEEEISEYFVNSLVPDLREFFAVPKLYWLSNMPQLPKKNELLVDFLNFLFQILISEAGISTDEEQRYAVLQKELTILILYLEDELFWGSEIEGRNSLLAETKTLANDAGRFIYSFVFATRPLKIILFYAGKHSLLRKFKGLNAKMKDAIFEPSLLLIDPVEDLRIIMSCRRILA